MEPRILTIPIEILTCIFEACEDFPQVVAFASVCKHIQEAWVTNSPSIIWSVGRSQVQSFDDALMAVRATAIVLKAYQAGMLPPAVNDISSLSGKSKLPDLAELKEVLNMRHLVRCIEFMYFYSSQDSEFVQYSPDDNPGETIYSKYPAARRRFPQCLQENIPGAESATIDTFRVGFYRAMYRILLAGAVLARAYMEPLFRAREEEDKVLKYRNFHAWCWGSSESYWSQEMEDLGDKVDPDVESSQIALAYLRQSPVYNFDVPDWSDIGQWRDREYEACFGPFASWIIEDGRKRTEIEPQNANDTEPSWAQNRADVGAVRELMHLLVAYEHLNYHFERGTRISYMQKQGNRTVTIVRFGKFLVEQITMPAAVEDLTDTYLSAEDHPALIGTEGEDMSLQFEFDFLSFVLPASKRAPLLYHKEHPGPLVEHELWNFALKRYLGLTFKSGTFWIPQLNSTWWREFGRGDIFLNPNWAPIQKYEPGVCSWDYRNN